MLIFYIIYLYNLHTTKSRRRSRSLNRFNYETHIAAWKATPDDELGEKQIGCSRNVKIEINGKWKLRKQWQLTCTPHDRAKFNKAVKGLKKLLEKKSKTIQI